MRTTSIPAGPTSRSAPLCGIGLIEAKITTEDPLRQSMRYRARWRVLLTQHIPTEAQRRTRGIRYLRWGSLLTTLQEQARSTNPRARFVASDLINYLQEHRMIPSPAAIEVYAWEINDEETLALFLQARMYGCDYERSSKLPKALYFAPHFGQRIAQGHPGVHVGIAYIARIRSVDVVTSPLEWFAAIRSVHGARWLKKHRDIIHAVRRHWQWSGRQLSIVHLDTPRLVFTPAIHKESLQRGRGWLSKRTFSFDELYAAWAS